MDARPASQGSSSVLVVAHPGHLDDLPNAPDALVRERAELGRFRAELARIQASAKRCVRARVLRFPAVARLYRALTRAVGRIS